MDVPPHSHWKILDSYHHSAVTSVPSLFLEPLPEAPTPGMSCWSVVLSPLCGWTLTHTGLQKNRIHHRHCLPLTCNQAVLVASAHLKSQVSIQHWHNKNSELARSVGFKHLSSALFHFPWEADFSIDFLRGSRGNWSARESWCMHHQDIIDIQNVKQQPGLSWDLDWWIMWTSTVSNISNDKYSIRFYQILSDSIIISYCIDQFLSGFLSFSFPNFIRLTASCKARDESDTARGTQASVAFRRLNMGYPWAIHGYTMPQIIHSSP